LGGADEASIMIIPT
jgi:hypothetical protein